MQGFLLSSLGSLMKTNCIHSSAVWRRSQSCMRFPWYVSSPLSHRSRISSPRTQSCLGMPISKTGANFLSAPPPLLSRKVLVIDTIVSLNIVEKTAITLGQRFSSTLCRPHVPKYTKQFYKNYLSQNALLTQGGMKFTSLSSAIHVRKGNPSSKNIVKHDVDVDCLLNEDNISRLEDNINRRKIDLNLESLLQDYAKFKELRETFQNLETEKQQISDKVKILVDQFKTTKKTSEATKRMKTLTKRGKELKAKIAEIKEEWYDLENSVMIRALKLPNDLDEITIDEGGSYVMLAEDKHQSINDEKDHDLPFKGHVELANIICDGKIHFRAVSPSAYYLEGRLAEAELSLIDCFSDHLLEAGFTPLSCPDMFKSVVVEGCGVDIEDPSEVFTLFRRGDLEDPDSDASGATGQSNTGRFKTSQFCTGHSSSDSHPQHNTTYHLTGASQMSATAYLTKNYIWENSLPAKWFSIGRHYQPVREDGDYSLFDTCQSSRVQLCCAALGPDDSDAMFEEMSGLLQKLYTINTSSQLFQFGRIYTVPADKLSVWERCRREIQLWSPGLKKFIPVAAVSKSNDFMSKRLMIKHSGRTHVHLVHGYAADVTKLIACFLEQSQTKSGKVDTQLFQSFIEMK